MATEFTGTGDEVSSSSTTSSEVTITDEGLTLTEAKRQLTAWLTASEKVAAGQAYSINGRSMTRADAGEIRENIVFWQKMCKQLNRGGIRVRGATPCG